MDFLLQLLGITITVVTVSFILFLFYKAFYDLSGLFRREIICHLQDLGCREIILSPTLYEDVDDHFSDRKNHFSGEVEFLLFPVRFVKVRYVEMSGSLVYAIIMSRTRYFRKNKIVVKILQISVLPVELQ